MSATISLIGAGILGLLLAGYFAQRSLPAPPPKVVGIDLGTTYSSIGVYHAISGDVEIMSDAQSRKTIPSVITFLPNGTLLVGYDAVAHAERYPAHTFYDAKRFIGKNFSPPELDAEAQRYPFKLVLNGTSALFVVPSDVENLDSKGKGARQEGLTLVSPEDIGGYILTYLLGFVRDQTKQDIKRAVISVPAEFNAQQRNATMDAALRAGLTTDRIISEPTAAALAYGLHKKPGLSYVMIVDLGGGTLDVSILMCQGGMFITRAMAGNNHLGGQDFNQRLLQYFLNRISTDFGQNLTNPEDLQNVRNAAEIVKRELTYRPQASIDLHLSSIVTDSSSLVTHVHYVVSRDEFEALNDDLFRRVLSPIGAALEDAELGKDEIDEIVLVGGSTRIPKVRRLIRDYFGNKRLNTRIDPELAVVTGVVVQAGVIEGGWPLQVSAVELPTKLRKRHIYD